ncbi:hypothetical protein [Streptomyces sp. TP-A0874]|uniref:hypothetical protein n=1 Tax=Streptomyces sp. TP-A0874 TaxID=549819 RepID=UPI000853D4E4
MATPRAPGGSAVPESTARENTASGDRRPGAHTLRSGPGRLLVWFYGVFTVAAVSRSAAQILTRFDEAPLAYTLSAVAGLVYALITLSLVRGGEGARRVGLVCCTGELLGVLGVGAWTLAEPSAFPDATVWSDFGVGYLFLPVALPVAGLLWLRRKQPAGEGGR